MFPTSRELGEEFLLVVNSLEPDEDIPVRYRELYQNFIRAHFPKLYKEFEVRLPVDGEGRLIEMDETAGRGGRRRGPRGGLTLVRTLERSDGSLAESGIRPS